ncbi:hypothetical protein fh0823_02300 [Francisella halioticida]|uniref:Uncharacterized protein n=1 Tax=Francisella halioticida TaxID=549298 RepID=A0ABN5AUJ1_9GAMM|nr:hypothetical protein [Francisella halioticida]ASG67571.1 hypothetical protein CDV26_03420 [Francisella halioticida]BCD90091.1 hypothetical protein fh0823_02300 [Francisella halioticida]
MYNKLVKDLLSEMKIEDSNILAEQQKYQVKDSFSSVELYISDNAISYRVFGDTYIMAMVKFLQIKLQNKHKLRNITLDKLVTDFDLPEVKYRNALQIVELIEKINERSAI